MPTESEQESRSAPNPPKPSRNLPFQAVKRRGKNLIQAPKQKTSPKQASTEQGGIQSGTATSHESQEPYAKASTKTSNPNFLELDRYADK